MSRGLYRIAKPASAPAFWKLAGAFEFVRSSRLGPVIGGIAIAMGVLIALCWAVVVRTPTMPAKIPSPSPTAIAIVSTPTPVPSVPTATPAVAPSPSVPTPTHAVPTEIATPTLEASPMIPSTGTPAQQAPRAAITSPHDNAVVRGVLSISGTATHPNFWMYVIHLAREPNLTNQWMVLGVHEAQVIDGVLETWDTTSVPDGSYSLRLRVVRKDGHYDEYYVRKISVANAQPSETPTLQEPQTFDTDAQKGPIRYILKDGLGLARHAPIFGVEDTWVEREKWAREIAARHPEILVFPGNIAYTKKRSSIVVEPLNFGYMIGGKVENFSKEDFTTGFDLVLSPSKRYHIAFLDPNSVRRQPSPLINGEIVRVFGYPEGENLLRVVLVDRYLREENRWQSWYFAPAEEGKRIWVYGKLNEWGFGGVEGVKHLMESHYGKMVAAYGFWQRPCPTCDIIAFRADEVYFWSEEEGVYVR